MTTERNFIQWLSHLQRPHPLVPLSIGDDAAWIRFGDDSGFVTTVDMVMDGVDFIVGKAAPFAIGRKALGVNLSDLAAMATTPVAALVSVALPRSLELAAVKDIYRGIIAMADDFNVHIAGGDTNVWDAPLAISITAFGRVEAPGIVKRSGAKDGDAILVTGELGGSIHGKHLDFTPRIKEALELNRQFHLHALADISDGIAKDLRNICTASGVGARLKRELIPVSAAAHRGQKDPLQHALTDGEDFELVLTMPQADADRALKQGLSTGTKLTQIGNIIADDGLWWGDTASGAPEEITWEGFEHG